MQGKTHFTFSMGLEIFKPKDRTALDFLLPVILFTCMMLILLGILCMGFRRYLKSSRIRGLDDATINRLPMFMHKKPSVLTDDGGRDDEDDRDDTTTSVRESECSICLGEYEEEEMIRVMPECGHSFHSGCVDEWLRSRSTCPLCRLSLDSSSTGLSVTVS